MPDSVAFPRAALPHRRDQRFEPVRASAAFSCRELCHLSDTASLQDSALIEHLLDRSVT